MFLLRCSFLQDTNFDPRKLLHVMSFCFIPRSIFTGSQFEQDLWGSFLVVTSSAGSYKHCSPCPEPPCHCLWIWNRIFTGSLSNWCWRDLWKSFGSSSAQSGPPRAGCLGPCSEAFEHRGGDPSQPLWTPCASAISPCSTEVFPGVAVCALCLLCCHWALLRRA